MFLTPEIMGKPRRAGDGNARVRSGGSRGVHRSGSPVRDRLLAATGERAGRGVVRGAGRGAVRD